MSLQSELMFDLIESYADVNVFFDRPKEEFKAKGAGLIITSNAVGHFPKKASDRYTVWFGRGIERWTYKNFKGAVQKVAEIMNKVALNKEVDINLRFEGKEIKRFHRELAKFIEGSSPPDSKEAK